MTDMTTTTTYVLDYNDREGNLVARGRVTAESCREAEGMAQDAMALDSCAAGVDHAVVWNEGTTLDRTGYVSREHGRYCAGHDYYNCPYCP